MVLLATERFQWLSFYLLRNISFAQPVQHWELELVASFLDMIYSGLARRNGMDQLCWKPSSKGVFDVKIQGITFHHPKQFSMEDFVEVESAI